MLNQLPELEYHTPVLGMAQAQSNLLSKHIGHHTLQQICSRPSARRVLRQRNRWGQQQRSTLDDPCLVSIPSHSQVSRRTWILQKPFDGLQKFLCLKLAKQSFSDCHMKTFGCTYGLALHNLHSSSLRMRKITEQNGDSRQQWLYILNKTDTTRDRDFGASLIKTAFRKLKWNKVERVEFVRQIRGAQAS